MLGTPYYMSPEQAQGIRAVDHRSDLWSLAVIVYQALTGRLPFESEALGDLLVQLIVSPVPVPSHVVQDLPPGFDAWFARAAQRDPGLRFQSAKDFGDGLGLALGLSSGIGAGERQYRPGESGPPPPPQTMIVGNQSTPGLGRTPPAAGTLAITPPPASNLLAAGTTPAPMSPTPTTGGPMSRTFAGGPAGAGRPNAGLFVALGGVALVVVVLGIVGISYAVKGKGTSAVTVGPTTSEPAVAEPVVKPTATALPTATLEPAASTTAAATAPPASVSAASPKPLAVPIVPVQPGPAVKPPPPTPGKKKPVDLGI
jgi:serine/threonine-protein kinase